MKTPFWFRSLNPVALLLWPLSVLYFLLSKIVFISRLFCIKRSKTPVICVGGILAGGVGKTPIVREIARYLGAPVVMRGYGGSNRKTGVPVGGIDSAADVGDEAKMLSLAGIDVYVGNRRDNIDAIDYREARPPAVVMDDGLQNPSVKKDVSLLVFDESVGVGNGLLLPAGPLREPLRSGIKRCGAVLINQSDSGSANCLRILRLAKKYKKAVFFVRREMETAGFFGKYVAFAGIGYPEKFFADLRAVPSMRVIEKISFPDHHFYGKKDILRLFREARKYEARLVSTEKDWVKLPRNIQAKVRFMPLKITLQPNFYVWLERKLEKKNAQS
jgi:tetraacyldisaccharide 4'-kinase